MLEAVRAGTEQVRARALRALGRIGGEELAPAEPLTIIPSLQAQQAQALTDMMERTVTLGTERQVFRERGMRVKGAVLITGAGS